MCGCFIIVFFFLFVIFIRKIVCFVDWIECVILNFELVFMCEIVCVFLIDLFGIIIM